MFKDVRGWVEEVDKLHQLKRIDGAHWDQEIGAITEITCREVSTKPALLFDKIKDYPAGYRLLSGILNTLPRMALTAGLPLDLRPVPFVQEWRMKMRNLVPIPPIQVSSGPVMENVMSWKDIDMFKFPAPLWHDEDGGRYIGTASLVITKDLESDWVNVGTYRVQVHDKNVLGFYASPGKHSRIHREKYYARGEACPVVMSFGHDPTIFLSACLQMSPGVCEYDIAGGIKGEPIEVIKGEVTGLPFPANSEIVIEGFSPADENMVEGPFGEYGGYYGSAERPEPIIKVERVYYRNNPIITGCPPSRPPSDTSFFHGPCTSAVIWDNMERAGVPDIRGVWQFEAATNWAFTAVSIKQRYPGHAKQAGILASQVQGGAYLGRYVVVVDDDIDPSNINDILWALGTRSDPERSCEILRRCWAGPLDTATPPGSPNLNSRLIIDACKPYEWMKDFAKELHIRPEVRQRVLEKWVNSLKT